MSEQRPVLVVERNGQTTVVTGWRALLLAVGALLSGLAALVFIAFIFLGIAITVGAVLLVAIPAAIGIAIAGALMGRRG
jgi:hypothetical protein